MVCKTFFRGGGGSARTCRGGLGGRRGSAKPNSTPTPNVQHRIEDGRMQCEQSYSFRFRARRLASSNRLVVEVGLSAGLVVSSSACGGSGVNVGRSRECKTGGETGVVGRKRSGEGSVGLSARTLSLRASSAANPSSASAGRGLPRQRTLTLERARDHSSRSIWMRRMAMSMTKRMMANFKSHSQRSWGW